jgi:hypothetical protein
MLAVAVADLAQLLGVHHQEVLVAADLADMIQLQEQQGQQIMVLAAAVAEIKEAVAAFHLMVVLVVQVL